jgi:hypothetical protein
MRRRLKWIIPAGTLGIALFTAIGGTVVMLLWNWLLPTLFGLKPISFWQAIGVLALSRILFGGFRLGGGGSRSWSRRRMEERWERMTPEERETFRQGVRGRCGRRWRHEPPAPSDPMPSV